MELDVNREVEKCKEELSNLLGVFPEKIVNTYYYTFLHGVQISYNYYLDLQGYCYNTTNKIVDIISITPINNKIIIEIQQRYDKFFIKFNVYKHESSNSEEIIKFFKDYCETKNN